MYIEFFGLPASGKTTICRYITKKNEGYNIVKQINSIKDMNFFLFIYTSLIFLKPLFILLNQFLFNDIFKRVSFIKKDFGFIRGLFVRYYQFNSSKKRGVFISDHGFIQTLSQNKLIRRSILNNKDFYLSSLNLLPNKNKIKFIYLDISVKKAKDRAKKRAKGRFINKDISEENQKFFNIMYSSLTKPLKLKSGYCNILEKQIKKEITQ